MCLFYFGVLLEFSIRALFRRRNLQTSWIMEQASVEEQIFEQIGPLTLLEIAPLNREQIIEKLESDLNIRVQSDDAVLFDRYFLSYIYNYFQTMKPRGFFFRCFLQFAFPGEIQSAAGFSSSWK